MSGGADSTALAVLAVAAGCDVAIVHVDHGLRPESAAEADLVGALAHTLAVPCRSVRVEVAPGPNLEARARAARLAAVGPGALTGHTADDQAETVLLHLLRGSGATGLAAMRPGPQRPLLGLRRAETAALCRRLGLVTVDDPMNHDPRFTRPRVRHEVLPLLADAAQRDPVPLLCRLADTLRDDDDLLTELAGGLDPTDARALAAAPRPLARRAVRRWLATAADHGYVPDAAAVDRVLAVASGQVRACEVAGWGRIVRRHQRLRIEPLDG